MSKTSDKAKLETILDYILAENIPQLEQTIEKLLNQ